MKKSQAKAVELKFDCDLSLTERLAPFAACTSQV
jgi:hypothetical protein